MTYYQMFRSIERCKFSAIFLAITTIFLLMPQFASAQNQEVKIPPKLYKEANTAKDANYLSESEKEVILYTNIARINGKWFIDNILNKYQSRPTSETKSLARTLRKNSGLQALKPSKNLTKSARFHAKDMGKHGKTGHTSSDGTRTFARIKRFAKGTAMAENCSYGYSDPIKIVLQLLIDEGVPSLGHRRNILSRSYKYVGVAIEPHKTYRYNCVQDFSNSSL